MSSEGKIDAELFGLWKKNLRNFFLRWDNNYSWPFSLTIEPAEKTAISVLGSRFPILQYLRRQDLVELVSITDYKLRAG